MYYRWLGEKYDGVRCFWNPIEKRMYFSPSFLYFPILPQFSYLLSLFCPFSSSSVLFLIHFRSSRRGIEIAMPPFKHTFGNIVLDGEIWYFLLLLLPLLFPLYLPFRYSILSFFFLSLPFFTLTINRCGRGQFIEAQITVLSTPDRVNWPFVR